MKILCISLGCDKNLVDTEMMLGLLNKDGHTFTDDENEADIILINTCCFINDAKEESVNTILEMAEYKKSGKCRALIVTGCMAQRYKEEIIKEIPEVDGILGTSTYDEISNVLNKALSGEQAVCFHDLSALPEVSEKRIVTTGGHYAFLKISEGCEQALYLLYYSVSPRPLPQRADGTSSDGSGTARRTGREGIDTGGAGDYAIRNGPLR